MMIWKSVSISWSEKISDLNKSAADNSAVVLLGNKNNYYYSFNLKSKIVIIFNV